MQGAENAVYEGRRTQVSSYLAQNRAALLSGDAGAAKGLFDVAGTPEANHAKVLQEINDVADQPDWTERATVIVMVHS